MTTAEIKALQDALFKDGDDLAYRAGAAIETLLARETEVLRKLRRMHTLSRDDNVSVALWNSLETARTILNPENG